MTVPPLVRLTWIVALVEATALLGYAVLVLLMAVRGSRSSIANVLLLTLILGLWAVGLAMAGRAVLATRRWGRTPIVLSQIFGVVVGVPVAQGGSLIPGGLLTIVAVAGLVAALSPQVTNWLTPVP